MVISELLKEVRNALNDNAEFEARQIVMFATGMSHAELIMKSKSEVSAEAAERVREITARRISGEPLQYILGTAEFMSLEFEVTPDTLIPRSDTETLVESVLDRIGEKKVKLLDIGTGTGCIAVSIAHYSNAEVTMLDFSANALAVAEKNALKHGVGARLLNMDILTESPDEAFDIIVSNPPYIETDIISTLQPEVRKFEPVTALDGGRDGLKFYRRITELAPKILNKRGLLAFEIGYNQGKSVADLMRNSFNEVEIIKDLCGNDRVVVGVLK